ncbi:MAG TPA: TIGR02453 family protein [Stellaceae bacterium]|nr:TIGR02453 family protein [Stellaceae bacterium]
MATTTKTPFAGFRPAAFEFFRGLAANNDPLWFKPRKAIYEQEVLAPFRALMTALGAALEAVGIPLTGDPGRGIFRIYRDVRFSANKQLYKTHQGGVLTRSGGKGDPGLLYVHLEPGASIIGAGFWHPPPELLNRLRRAVALEPDAFLAMAGQLQASGYALTCENERLSRLPRGFEIAKGSAVADYVCWKNFLADTAIGDAEMQSPDLVGRIVAFALAARPLLDWGWAAEGDDIPPPLTLKMPTRPLPAPDF